MTRHALSGILNSAHRRAIHAVLTQISAQSEKKAFKYMPIVNVPAAVLEHEIISSFGGLTGERALGEKGKAIAGLSTETKLYKPGAYQEFHTFTESDLLKLRKAGTYDERGVTGLNNSEVSITDRIAKKLETRLYNRMQKLAWDAIFEGKFVHKGIETNFGIPTANSIATASDWSNPGTGDPVFDLLTIINESDVLRKYKIKEFVMNGKTSSKIKKAILAQNKADNYNIRKADINELMAFYAPELDATIEIVKDSYQEETVDADGRVSVGHAQFFVPDNKILLVPDFGGVEYGQYGELQITENMNDPSATVDSPAQGVYTFIDEDGLKDRQAPSVKIVSGFNGGANLMRPQDVLTIDC